jgi:hypothetical protein
VRRGFHFTEQRFKQGVRVINAHRGQSLIQPQHVRTADGAVRAARRLLICFSSSRWWLYLCIEARRFSSEKSFAACRPARGKFAQIPGIGRDIIGRTDMRHSHDAIFLRFKFGVFQLS